MLSSSERKQDHFPVLGPDPRVNFITTSNFRQCFSSRAYHGKASGNRNQALHILATYSRCFETSVGIGDNPNTFMVMPLGLPSASVSSIRKSCQLGNNAPDSERRRVLSSVSCLLSSLLLRCLTRARAVLTTGWFIRIRDASCFISCANPFGPLRARLQFHYRPCQAHRTGEAPF